MNMHARAAALAALIGSGTAALADVPPPGSFTLFPVGTHGKAVSNNGYATGFSFLQPTGLIRFTPGQGFQNLGWPFDNNGASAAGINNAGTIVGQTSGGTIQGAYRHDTIGGFSIVVPRVGATPGAYAISNSGFITGSNGSAAFTYSPSTGVTLIGSSTEVGFAVNESGQVTGFGGSTTFLYTPGAGVQYIPTPNTSSASGRGINDQGQIVIEAVHNSLQIWQGFVYTPGQGVAQLPGSAGVPTQPADINNHGWVVGHLNSVGTLWIPGEAPVNLTTYVHTYFGGSYTIDAANAINDSGVIVGSLRDANGSQRGYMLQIPSPGGVALLALGIPILRRKRGL